MGKFGIIVPSAATNYIQNPAFRYGVDGWSAYTTETATGTRTRGVAYAMQGFYAYQIDKTSAADTGDYGIADTVAGFAEFDSGDVLAISAYVHIEDGARVTLEAEVTNAGGSETVSVSEDGPYTGRITATGTLTADATAITVRAYVPDDYAGYFYITGIQLELDQLTTYFDGFTQGCYWDGEYSNSNSVRPVTVSKGGVETDFDDYAFYITGTIGLGAAEINNQYNDYSSAPGGYFDRARTPVRSGSLVGELIGTSQSDWHSKRDALYALFNPETGDNREVTIYYEGSGTRLYLDVMLDGGFGSYEPNGFSERIAIRLLALNPFWYLDYQESAEMDGYQSMSSLISYLMDGQWYEAGSSTVSEVEDILYYRGMLYIAGSFATVDGVSNTANLCAFDGTSFTALGTGPSGGRVRCLAIGPDGNLYAGGDFTSMGGVANTAYIAMWDWSSWNDVDGAGINGAVYDMKTYEDRLYVCGNMTDYFRVLYWRPRTSSATSYGTNNPSATVTCMDVDSDGKLYIGGTFANIGGDADMSYMAEKGVFDTAWQPIGTGANAKVNSIIVQQSGDVFFAGDFTVVDGDSYGKAVLWNGSNLFAAYDTGFAVSGGDIDYALEDTNGNLIFAGLSLTKIGDLGYYTLSSVALWDGYALRNPGFYANDTVNAMAQGGRYTMIVGNDGKVGARNLLSNGGTAQTTPIIRILPDSNTTREIEKFNLYHNGLKVGIYFGKDLAHYSDEEIILNYPSEGQIYSSFRDNMLRWILPSSQLADFTLRPGTNNITAYTAFYSGEMTVEFAAYWVPRYISADG